MRMSDWSSDVCSSDLSDVAFLANAALEYLILVREPEKWGSEHAQQVPYKAFRSLDGWVVIGAGFSNLFAQLCKVLERQDLIADPRFIELQDRVNNRDELYAILDADRKSTRLNSSH